MFPFLISVSAIVPYLIIVLAAILLTVIFYVYIKASVKEIESTNKRDIELIDKLIDDKKLSVIKRNKILKVIKNILFYALIVIVVPFIIYATIAKIKGGTPKIGNTTVMVVGSGSMSFKNEANPYLFSGDDERLNLQFQKGDIIFLNKVDGDSELEVYDIICYFDASKNENIIHRIIEIKDGSIKKYITRGDANNGTDETEPTLKDVVGEYKGSRIPKIGHFVLFLQNPIGITTIFSLLYLLLAVDYILKRLTKKEKQKQDKFEKIIGYDNLKIKFLDEYQEEHDFNKITICYLDQIYVFNKDGFISKNISTEYHENLIKTVEIENEDDISYEFKINK